MKTLLKSFFAVIVIAVVLVIAYFGFTMLTSSGREVKLDGKTKDSITTIQTKIKDTPLKTKEGDDLSVDDLITTNEDGTVTPNMDKISELDKESIQSVANTLTPEDVDALKDEVMRNPALMQQAMQLIDHMN